MKQHHPLLRRMLCAALALAVACMGTPALAKSIPALDPEMTVNSSHAIYYGSEASLADGVYGAQENVDGEGWVYVQTAADGTDNHVVFTVDLHETRTVYASGIGTIVNGWAEKMENLTLSASENGTDYTPLAAFDNAELAAEWGHRHEWACPEGAPVTARYLRYEFDIATSQITDGAVHYVCVDEIDVRTEADTPEPPPVVDPDPGDCVNLAAGRPYTSAWAASGSYADDGGQLTDGVYSRALSCKAPEWVGYYNEVQDGFEFIVDLGESKRFEQVKMNFLREEGSGIWLRPAACGKIPFTRYFGRDFSRYYGLLFRFLLEAKARSGQFIFDCAFWGWRHLACRLFRVGTLEFEYRPGRFKRTASVRHCSTLPCSVRIHSPGCPTFRSCAARFLRTGRALLCSARFVFV